MSYSHTGLSNSTEIVDDNDDDVNQYPF